MAESGGAAAAAAPSSQSTPGRRGGEMLASVFERLARELKSPETARILEEISASPEVAQLHRLLARPDAEPSVAGAAAGSGSGVAAEAASAPLPELAIDATPEEAAAVAWPGPPRYIRELNHAETRRLVDVLQASLFRVWPLARDFLEATTGVPPGAPPGSLPAYRRLIEAVVLSLGRNERRADKAWRSVYTVLVNGNAQLGKTSGA